MPLRSSLTETLRPYILAFASNRSRMTDPSSDTPAKSPRVLLYEYTAATLFTDAVPEASALRPIGPAATKFKGEWLAEADACVGITNQKCFHLALCYHDA